MSLFRFFTQTVEMLMLKMNKFDTINYEYHA